MKVYDSCGYPREKTEIPDINIVEFLTSDERSEIMHGHYDEEWEEERRHNFAINYGDMKGDGAPFMRGFEFNGKLYEIQKETKIILIQPPRGMLFYDSDKVGGNSFLVEGSLDEFVEEFIRSGYKLEHKRLDNTPDNSRLAQIMARFKLPYNKRHHEEN